MLIMKRSVIHPGRLEARKSRWAYVFLAPWLLVFGIFYAYPLFYGIYVSFTNFTLGSRQWTGLQNYQKILQDYAFWRSLLATFAYSLIVIPLQVFLPLWAANTLRPHGRGFNTLTKMLLYLPGVTCSVALVLSWKFALAPNTGLLAQFMAKLGVYHVSVLDNARLSVPILSLLIVLCNLGANLIIYCAALDAIPETYYEAAELDGASRGQQFRNITMPMLHPTIVYVFITSTIGALQIFVIPQLMTGGGPNYTSSTLLMLIYSSAFTNNQFGYASAIGVVLFLITAVIAFFQFRITRRDSIEY